MNLEKQKEVIRRRRTTTIGKLVLSLTPEQIRAYDRWQRLCRRLGVPITPQSRLEWLFDCKEMPQ